MAPPDHDNAETANAVPKDHNECQALIVEEIRKFNANRRIASQGPNSNGASSGEETVEASSTGGASKKARIASRAARLKELFELEVDVVGDGVPIRSEAELEEVEEALVLMNSGEQHSEIPSGYPETEDGFIDHCYDLFEAITNLGDIDEATDSTAARHLRSKKVIERDILAGKFMKAIRKAQLGRLFRGNKAVQPFNNFTKRFQAVVDALKVSKLLVHSAFIGGDEWINRIALNPAAELRLKRNNKKLNDVKTEKNRLGGIEMKKQGKPLNKAATALKPSTPAARRGDKTQAPGNSSKKAFFGASGGRQVESDTSPVERPHKRAKVSHGQVQMRVGNDKDDLPTFSTELYTMNAPGPSPGSAREPSGRSGTENTSQLRNGSVGVRTPGVKDEVKVKVEDDDLFPWDN